MNGALNVLAFALDRVRSLVLVIALIVLFKAAWIMLTPALSGS